METPPNKLRYRGPKHKRAERFITSTVQVDDGPNAELSPTTLLSEHGVALFVRHLRCERGDELFEARIATQGIPLGIKT